MDASELFEKVKRLQKDKGLSNRRLCELAGVSHSSLDNWKRRQVIPSVPILEGFCEVLNISMAQLFIASNSEDLTEDQKIILELWSTLKSTEKYIIKELIKNMRSK